MHGEWRRIHVTQHNIHPITTREKVSTKPAIANVDAWEFNQSRIIDHITAVESKLDQLLKKLDNISDNAKNLQNHKPNFNSSWKQQHKNHQDHQNRQPPPKASQGAQKRLRHVTISNDPWRKEIVP